MHGVSDVDRVVGGIDNDILGGAAHGEAVHDLLSVWTAQVDCRHCGVEVDER
jgi:hypothetical protein